jgi:hypothetical protein
MASAALATAAKVRSSGNVVPFETGLHPRIGALLQERDALYEEVRQLRAAVQIYREVVQRLQSAARTSRPDVHQSEYSTAPKEC